jgi:hypothetical protein
VTSCEITEMMAFERLEPFGSLHHEMMAGRICSTLANMHLTKGAQALTPADFMPSLHSAMQGYADRLPQRELTADERSAQIDKAFFGRVLH